MTHPSAQARIRARQDTHPSAMTAEWAGVLQRMGARARRSGSSEYRLSQRITRALDARAEKCLATLRNPACVRPVHGMANKVEALGRAAQRPGLSIARAHPSAQRFTRSAAACASSASACFSSACSRSSSTTRRATRTSSAASFSWSASMRPTIGASGPNGGERVCRSICQPNVIRSGEVAA
jgi:hypothetical protein